MLCQQSTIPDHHRKWIWKQQIGYHYCWNHHFLFLCNCMHDGKMVHDSVLLHCSLKDPFLPRTTTHIFNESNHWILPFEISVLSIFVENLFVLGGVMLPPLPIWYWVNPQGRGILYFFEEHLTLTSIACGWFTIHVWLSCTFLNGSLLHSFLGPCKINELFLCSSEMITLSIVLCMPHRSELLKFDCYLVALYSHQISSSKCVLGPISSFEKILLCNSEITIDCIIHCLVHCRSKLPRFNNWLYYQLLCASIVLYIIGWNSWDSTIVLCIDCLVHHRSKLLRFSDCQSIVLCIMIWIPEIQNNQLSYQLSCAL